MNKTTKQLSLEHTLFAWSNQKGLDPIHIKKAKGVYLYDDQGKRYIDFSSQLMNVNIEHGREKITVSLKKLMRISRIATFVLASLALLVALLVAISTLERTIFWFVLVCFHGIAASFCPTIILALFWKGFTEKRAIAAMTSGFLGVLFFKFIMPRLDGIGIYFDKIAELAPALLIGLFSGYLVSKLFPDKPATE